MSDGPEHPPQTDREGDTEMKDAETPEAEQPVEQGNEEQVETEAPQGEPQAAPPPSGPTKGSLPPPPGQTKRHKPPARVGVTPTDAEAAVVASDSSSEEDDDSSDGGMEDGQGVLVVAGGAAQGTGSVNQSGLGPGGVEAVLMRESDEEPMGFEFDEFLVLRTVVPETPAAAAGLGRLLGMQLKQVNGEAVHNPDDLPADFETANALVLGLAPATYKAAAPAHPNLAANAGALVPVSMDTPMMSPADIGFRPPGVPAGLPPLPLDGLSAPLPKTPVIRCPPLARVPRALSGRFVPLPKQEGGAVVPVCVAGGVPEQRPSDSRIRQPFYVKEGPNIMQNTQYSTTPTQPKGGAGYVPPGAYQSSDTKSMKIHSFAPSRSGGEVEVTASSMPLPESSLRPGGGLRFDPGVEIPLPNNHEVLPFKMAIPGEAPTPSAPHGKGPGWTPQPPPSMHPDRGLMFDPDRERGTAPGGSTCLSVGRRFHQQKEQGGGRPEDQTTRFQGQYANEWGQTADGTFVPGKTGESYVPGRGRQDGSGMGNATSARISSARPPPTSTPGEELRFEGGCEMLSFGESLLDIHLTVPGTAAHAKKNKIFAMKRFGQEDSDEEDQSHLKGSMRHPLTGLLIDDRDYHSVPNEVLSAKKRSESKKALVINTACGDIGGVCPPPPALLPYAPKPPLSEADKNRLIASFRSRHQIPDEFEYALRGLDSEGLRSVLRPLLDAGRDPTTVLTARINLEKRRIRAEQLKIAGGNVVRENADPKNDPMLEEAVTGHVLASPCPSCAGPLSSFTTDEAWLCSGCNDKFAKNTSGFFGCRKCEYDLCPRCARGECAKMGAVAAAIILAGRALEALADAWEHAKRRQAQKRRAEKRKHEELQAQRNPLCHGLPFQPGMAVDVLRSNGVWTPAKVKTVKEGMGTLIYVVVLDGEGNFQKQIPVKKADGRMRPRTNTDGDVYDDEDAKRRRLDTASNTSNAGSGRASSQGISSSGRAMSRGSGES